MVEKISLGFANCYLLRGAGGSILIDTGMHNDGKRILDRVRGKNLKLILLTHGHFDHVGSTQYLAKRLGVPIAMSEKDAHLIGNGTASRLRGSTPLGWLMARHSQPVLKCATYSRFSPSVFLEDGQSLADYGVNARVVALPGHTPGSLGVLTEDGELILGDAMFHMLRPTGSRLYEERMEMERSLKKISELPVKIIFPGHGKPIQPDCAPLHRS